MNSRRQRFFEILLILCLLLLAAAVRLPLFVNAEALLNSDEAFNALSVRHLLRGDCFFLHYPGQDYQGITEGLLGVFLTKLFGWSALSYKLSAFTFYLFYLVALYGLAREAFGRRAAVMAGIFGAVTAPTATYYSVLATGGHIAVLAFAAFMLFCLLRYESSQRIFWLYVLCFTAGFSYYTYKLSSVSIAPIAACGIYRAGILPIMFRHGWTQKQTDHPHRLAKCLIRFMDVALAVLSAALVLAILMGRISLKIGPAHIHARTFWGTFRWIALLLTIRIALSWRVLQPFVKYRLKVIVICLALLLAGLVPLIMASVVAPPDKKANALGLAAPAQRAKNLRMLWKSTLPSILGYELPAVTGSRTSDLQETEPWRMAHVLGLIYAAVAVYALCSALHRDFRKVITLSGERLSPQSVLLLAAAVVPAAYCASGYVVDITSARYLIPLLAASPALVAGAFCRLSNCCRRIRLKEAGWIPAILVCVALARQNLDYCRDRGFVAKEGMHIEKKVAPPRLALEYLRNNGVKSAYGTYWIAYLMTFLADDQFIVAPYHHINERKPPDYHDVVRKDPDPAYIFLFMDSLLRKEFQIRMLERNVPWHVECFHGFERRIFVYHSNGVPLPHDL